MDLTNEKQSDGADPAPPWTPLTERQRRVVGVLIEKSKTTPDVYPMTVNSIRAGANQKSNRNPKMELENEEVEDTLTELRKIGAVIESISDSRVPKYKHRMYEWLGIERAEMAVMAELLLRGEQTLGDLRARASRMEKIAGIDELKPIVQTLFEKGLMVELTPPGRGQVVTHNLYLPEELVDLRAQTVGRPVAASDSVRSSPEPGLSGQLLQLTERVAHLEAVVQELQCKLSALVD